MNELCQLPANQLSQLLGAGEISSVELTSAYLDRIDRYNNRYHAYVTPTPDMALQQAVDADNARRQGKNTNPLLGMPVALKDAYDTAGVSTTVCSKLLAGRVPEDDAFVWSRLKSAGAILLGKLECTEFCLGGPATDGLVSHAKNPWNKLRYAGGSSSGAGVALASRLTPLALGSDTGGSIRIPAACCGVAGHKPTYGLVSLAGLFPLSGSLDHAGPLATCSADCALLLDAIAGYDNKDPASARVGSPQAFRSLSENLEGLRVGYVVNFSELPDISDAMQQSTSKALGVLRDLGAELVDIELPDLWDYTICNSTIMMAEAFSIHEQRLQTQAAEYTEFTRARISLGALISATDYINAQKMRRELALALKNALRTADVLVYPGMLGEPPVATAIQPFYFLKTPLITAPANVGGIPTTSVCCGYSTNGLPQAIQISGRWFEDATVLKVAHAYETAVGLTSRLPPDIEV